MLIYPYPQKKTGPDAHHSSVNLSIKSKLSILYKFSLLDIFIDPIFTPYPEELSYLHQIQRSGWMLSSTLTVTRCSEISSSVEIGLATNGSLSHEIPTVVRRVTGLSPIAVFFPTTHFTHFLRACQQSTRIIDWDYCSLLRYSVRRFQIRFE